MSIAPRYIDLLSSNNQSHEANMSLPIDSNNIVTVIDILYYLPKRTDVIVNRNENTLLFDVTHANYDKLWKNEREQ